MASGSTSPGLNENPARTPGVVRDRRTSSARKSLTRAVCALLCGAAAVSHAAGYEAEIKSFSAYQTFPAKWLKGDGYLVDPDVINQDFMNHYRVRSRFGDFTARGDAQLFVRIRELQALDAGHRRLALKAGNPLRYPSRPLAG